ncbi:hypothetical protein CEXT_83971, partial [Caerostris extrusa]
SERLIRPIPLKSKIRRTFRHRASSAQSSFGRELYRPSAPFGSELLRQRAPSVESSFGRELYRQRALSAESSVESSAESYRQRALSAESTFGRELYRQRAPSAELYRQRALSAEGFGRELRQRALRQISQRAPSAESSIG